MGIFNDMRLNVLVANKNRPLYGCSDPSPINAMPLDVAVIG